MVLMKHVSAEQEAILRVNKTLNKLLCTLSNIILSYACD